MKKRKSLKQISKGWALLTNAMQNNKRIVFLVLISLISLTVTIGYSYSWFSKKDTIKVFQVTVGNLVYNLESSEFNNNQEVSVDKNNIKEFTITVTSQNKITSKYKLYYEGVLPEGVKIEYSVLPGDDNVTGEIGKSDVKKIKVKITNNSSQLVNVKLGITGGFKHNEVQLGINEFEIIDSYKTINVTFNPGGGNLTELEKTYIHNEPYGTLPTPTRTGYTFNGWYTKEGVLVTKDTLVDYLTDNTLYAKWNINTYTLTVNPSGGTWNNSTSSQNFNISYKGTKEIPQPTRSGYTFDGWTVSGGTLSGTTFTMGAGNATLTAKWKINTYTLTVNPNGGTWNNSTSNQNFSINYKGTKEIPQPTRTGYTFTGWSASSGTLSGTTFTIGAGNATLTANWKVNKYPWIVYHYKQNIGGTGYTLVSADTGEGEADYGTVLTPNVLTYTGFTSPAKKSITIDVDTTPPTKNKVDYNYSRNQYTLTVNPNGGSWNNSTQNTSQTLYYEQTKTIENPTKVGYTFTNWTISGTGSKLTDKTFQMGNSNTTLTAGYRANTYIVTLNANGGSVSTGSKTVTYNSTYGTLPTPTRTGYTFIGWYTSTSGGTNITSSTQVKTSSNHTLYARWQANTYTIKYNANGGTGTMANKTVTYDSNHAISSNSFTKTGYTFLGWTTNSDGTDDGYGWTNWSGTWKYVNGQFGVSNNTLTLYARWKANTYTIKYSANGGSGTMANKTATYDSTHAISSNSFTRTGYTFLGWTTNSNGTDDGYGWTNWSGTWKYVNGQFGVSNNTLTLYARWQANQYNVVYYANGGTWSGGTTWSNKATYGQPYVTEPNWYTAPSGYVFDGWNEKADGSGSSWKDWIGKEWTWSYTRNVNLYAQWKKSTFSRTGELYGFPTSIADGSYRGPDYNVSSYTTCTVSATATKRDNNGNPPPSSTDYGYVELYGPNLIKTIISQADTQREGSYTFSPANTSGYVHIEGRGYVGKVKYTLTCY